MPGDWVIILAGIVLVTLLFDQLWLTEPATKLRIRQGDKIYAEYSLDQQRSIDITGPLGSSRIDINQGKVRIEKSPCTNQYCVHQGWLHRAGQVAICLPNQVSLELLGSKKIYDSLNY